MNTNGNVRTGILAAAMLLLWAAVGTAQAETITEPESYLRLHYDKHEYRIKMRDGVRLFTAVYTPKDKSRAYPILMKRTPYSVRPYGENKYPKVLGPSLLFAKEGYIFVYQDVRGRFLSEGKFVHVTPHIDHKTSNKQIDESSDTFDTIAWLLKHVPNHNGRVGQWGVSYPGFYAAAGMIDAHPALKAVSPQAPVSDWLFDDFQHPEPFVPGRPTRVTLELQDVLHRFEPGHRLMVQIQSTWFPLVDRNPQKYVENVFLAGEKDFRKATQRVYHSADHPSRLSVRVLEPAGK